MDFAPGLRAIRDEKGWSQEKLARKAELSRGTIANIELHKVDEPDFKTIEAIAQALSMKLWELIRRVEEWAAPDLNREPWDYKFAA